VNYDFANTQCYPGSGTTITDLAGTANAATYGSPPFSSGYFTLNGSNQHIGMTAGCQGRMSPANSGVTISSFVWVYPMDNGVILDEQDGGWHDSHIEMVGGRLRFRTWYFGGSYVTSSTGVSLNTWMHLGYTFDGGTFRAYVNGASVGSMTGSRDSPGNNGFRQMFHLGLGDSTNMGDGTYANMRVGTLQVYNVASSSSDVSSLFSALRSRYGI